MLEIRTMCIIFRARFSSMGGISAKNNWFNVCRRSTSMPEDEKLKYIYTFYISVHYIYYWECSTIT